MAGTAVTGRVTARPGTFWYTWSTRAPGIWRMAAAAASHPDEHWRTKLSTAVFALAVMGRASTAMAAHRMNFLEEWTLPVCMRSPSLVTALQPRATRPAGDTTVGEVLDRPTENNGGIEARPICDAIGNLT